MSDPPQSQPTPNADTTPGLEPGVRAARQRGALTQQEVADRLGVSIETYRRWDRGTAKPRDPEKQQLLARVLATPHEVLFPAAANPQVAQAMRLLDLEDAAAAAAVRDSTAGDQAQPESQPTTLPAESVAVVGSDPAPAPRVAPSRFANLPDPAEVLRSIDGSTSDRPYRRAAVGAPGRHTSLRARIAVGACIIAATAAAVVALVTGSGGEPDSAPTARVAAGASSTAQLQQRRNGQAMNAAASRGDFDAAIRLASSFGDRAAADRWRTAAATLMVKRAGQAAERGDLSLARSRLSRAQDRYDAAPGDDAVRTRIAAIERARAERKRAAARKQAAARLASARRRAAVTSAPAESTADVGSRAGSFTTEPSTLTPTPAPTPKPTPTPAPAPSGGGSSSGDGSGGSGGGSGKGTVDPGLF